MKLFFLLICTMFIFSSCQTKYENWLKDNTSEIRDYLFEGFCEDFEVSLTVGQREKNYIVNGESSELVDFGVLSFVLDEDIDVDINSAKFVLFVGTKKFEGDLQENPFDHSLMADIQTNLSSANNISVNLISNNYLRSTSLNCVNANWNIKSSDIYSIISKKMKNEIKSFVKNNNFEGEVYIKIINDADKNVQDYYWYVCIIGRKGERLSAIISHKNSEILALNSYL